MEIRRTIETRTPLERVFSFLSDFTTTEQWDPGTVTTERVSGDGGPGTAYRNVSKFLGRETELVYVVRELVPQQRLVMEGTNKTVTATDTLVFSATASGGTRVDYHADFAFQGTTGRLAPLLYPVLAVAFKRLGDEAQRQMTKVLDEL